jgi:hypothetical protein
MAIQGHWLPRRAAVHISLSQNNSGGLTQEIGSWGRKVWVLAVVMALSVLNDRRKTYFNLIGILEQRMAVQLVVATSEQIIADSVLYWMSKSAVEQTHPCAIFPQNAAALKFVLPNPA